MQSLRFALPLTILSAVLATAAACGDDDDAASSAAPADAGPEAAPDAPVVVTNDNESKQSGKIVRAQTEDEGVAGATVTVGSATATTNATGDYEILVPRSAPYQVTVSAPDYFKLIDQEMILAKENLARGSTTLLPTATANFLAGLLPDRNPEKGLVVVKVNPQPPCETEEGSTVTIDPPGEAKLTYFGAQLPDSSRTSVLGGATFSAAFYNVEVGVPITVTVTSPSCAQVPFPVEVGDVTYTGVQRAEPGEALSYLRLYIKDPVASDAGTD